MSTLNNEQKRKLANLARRAFNLAGARLRGDASAGKLRPAGGNLQEDLEALALNGSDACFTTWRHEQVFLACDKHGLRLCTQLDYQKVRAHFLDLIGQTDKAFNAHLRGQTEELRQWLWKINHALAVAGYATEFADRICRDQNKCVVADLKDARLAKNLFFSVTNRIRAKAAKQQGAALTHNQEVAA